MILIFAIVFGLFVLSNPAIPKDGRIAALENEPKIEVLIDDFNQLSNAENIRLHYSVGNHGRYKNIGFDYELLHRNDKYPTEYEYRKGLRRYDGQGFAFIYFESEYTVAFVNYLRDE